jgi:predicted Zn-dependent protease with MMP-like domain
MTGHREFEEHVRRALDGLPDHIARALDNVAVVVEEEDPRDPDLFGLWESEPYMPDKITIFRRPLVESFPDPEELEREIRITVLHELAHYFGLEEDEIRDLGYG